MSQATTERRYRAGIIGLTGIGARRDDPPSHPALGEVQAGSHAAAYASASGGPRTEVVAVCDLRGDLLEAFNTTWGDVWPEVHVYTDYRQMLQREQLDLLSVVTSDDRHADMVVEAAAAGVRGIFCEKPIATTLADADRMIAACEEHGVALSVDHTRRFRGQWHQVRDLVRSGDLGQLRAVVVTMAYPRAMLFRNGTHMIDMLCFLVGSEPEWVVAELDDRFQHYGPAYAGDGGHDPATDPGGFALLRFRNGVRAQIVAPQTEVGTATGFDLICQRGRVSASDDGVQVWESRGERPASGRSLSRPLPPVYHTFDGQRAGIEELVQHLDAREAGREPPAPLVSPGTAARQTLEIILGILRSHHEGNAKITFPLRGE